MKLRVLSKSYSMMKINLPPDWSEEIGLCDNFQGRSEHRYVIILVYTVFTYNIFRNLTSCCFCHPCRRKRSWETLSRRKTLSMRIQNNMIEPPKKAIFLIKIILYADQESFKTPLKTIWLRSYRRNFGGVKG